MNGLRDRRWQSWFFVGLVTGLLLVSCAEEVPPAGRPSAGLPSSTSSPLKIVERAPLPDPHAAPGQRVVITPKGIYPDLLLATVEVPITWENRTGTPLEIHSSLFRSGEVPPDHAFRYRPQAAVSISYEVVSGVSRRRAVVQVEPPYMPGETPVNTPPKNFPNVNWPYVSPSATPSGNR